ncbi:unnamed protein product [Schistosoma turkestanicum]|nr:unnamed protein product [Schistosoma turkestanicum]
MNSSTNNHNKWKRSMTINNLEQFHRNIITFTEKRNQSIKHSKSLHKSLCRSKSLIQLKTNKNIMNEYELRQINDLLNEIDNNQMNSTTTTNETTNNHNETIVNLNNMIQLPIIENELTNLERLYLYAAEQGDLGTIKQLTDQSIELKLNLNCTDTLGRDVLRIAIENEHMELLQFLVSLPNLELKDCLLHAINEDNVLAVEIILHAQTERGSKKNLKVSVFL